MFGIGSSEIMVIAIAAIVIFGARRLPEIGSALGKGFRNFRKTLDGREDTESSTQSQTPNSNQNSEAQKQKK